MKTSKKGAAGVASQTEEADVAGDRVFWVSTGGDVQEADGTVEVLPRTEEGEA